MNDNLSSHTVCDFRPQMLEAESRQVQRLIATTVQYVPLKNKI